MSIMDTWKQSLQFFTKKELLMFLFSWFRRFKGGLTTFLRYFGLLVILNITLRMLLSHFSLATLLTYEKITHATVIFSSLMILSVLSIFFALLCVRASLETKTINYFTTRAKRLYWFFIIYFVLLVPFNVTTFMFGYNPNQSWFLLTTLKNSSTLNFVLLLVILPIAVFFSLDSKLEGKTVFQGIKNSFKTFFHFIPIFAAFLALYFLLYYLLIIFLAYVPHIVRLSTLFCFDFFFISGVAVLYTKIRHSNYQLFFTSNK